MSRRRSSTWFVAFACVALVNCSTNVQPGDSGRPQVSPDVASGDGTVGDASRDTGIVDSAPDAGIEAGIDAPEVPVDVVRVDVRNCVDADGDGYGSGPGCLGPDCDDANPDVHPGGTESCNNLDDDCNGMTDDGLGQTTCGVAACRRTVSSCLAGMLQRCIPGAPGPEVCNGIDDNCNGMIDDGIAANTCGVGACVRTQPSCMDGMPIDCVPGMPVAETCNGRDADCDGMTDEGLGSTTCGVGACVRTTPNCAMGISQTCAPGTPAIETCNGIDDNCNGMVDDGAGPNWYRDADLDGFGNPMAVMRACTVPAGHVSNNTDCDDTMRLVSPIASEICNGRDDDCDGMIDEGVTTTYFRDADGDTYGSSTLTTQACTLPAGYSARLGDCNDASATVHPGIAEICNNVDDNCSGAIDETFACRVGTTESCLACGFTGTRSCVAGCSWGACRGFSLSRVYDDTVTSFSHSCGYDVGAGDWAILGAPSPGCDIVSGGPGLVVPTGRFEVDFYFADTGTFDFYVYNAGTLVGSTTYTNTSGFPHVIVPFTIASGCGNITLRLFGRTGARIRLYTVTIRRIGD